MYAPPGILFNCKTMKKILFALVALLGIVACENTTIEPINDTIKLSVDNTEIYANGSQVASFSVVNDKGDTPYYDLLGRPVANPTRGIYIKDEKKVAIK